MSRERQRAIRFGNLHGSRQEQTIVIIDGGFSDIGDELVGHVKSHFITEVVDIVINTHPDMDHELIGHQLWNHTDGLADKFQDVSGITAHVTRAKDDIVGY